MGQGFRAQRGREGERAQRITCTAEIEPGANGDMGYSDLIVPVARNECWWGVSGLALLTRCPRFHEEPSHPGAPLPHELSTAARGSG